MADNENLDFLSGDSFDIDSLLNTIDTLVSGSGHPEEIEAQTPSPVQMQMDGLKSDGFSEAQIEEISKGKAANLPVEVYAKQEYNWMQMYELRMGLLHGLNTDLYSSHMFSANQMREIRLGLQDHLDANSYANLILSATDMQAIRKTLFTNAYKANNGKGYGRSIKDDETGITIRLSDNCMEAYVTIPKEVKDLSESELMQVLENHDITYGLMEENIRKLASGKHSAEEIRVAEGKAPFVGRDGWYELFFDNCIEKGHTVPPDGEIDYTDVITIELIKPGDRLALYHPAQKDTGGITVTNLPIEGTPGMDLPVLTGVGFVFDADSGIYSATEKGYASYNDFTSSLNVWRVYQVKGDVHYYQSVEFDGTVHVSGSVRSMATIRAKGDIIIDGFVESATVISEQNIVIKGGANGGGQGKIEAGGSIRASFFENIDVVCKGMVESNYYFNSNIDSEDRVVARGRKARILGGKITASLSVDTVIVGDYMSSKTLFNIGDTNILNRRITDVATIRKGVLDELQQLAVGKQKLILLLGEEIAEGNALYIKTCTAIQVKEQQLQNLEREIDRLKAVIKRAEHAYIKIHGQLQSEVVFIINNVKKETPTPLGKSVFLTKKDCIRKQKH